LAASEAKARRGNGGNDDIAAVLDHDSIANSPGIPLYDLKAIGVAAATRACCFDAHAADTPADVGVAGEGDRLGDAPKVVFQSITP
jgi:hypothetical protein